MKKNRLLLFLSAAGFLWTSGVSAQMFYNPKSSFDKTGSTSSTYNSPKKNTDDDSNREEAPFEKIVAAGIRERIRADAAYIVGEPEETLCYGIARKSPKKRSATIDGYAHTGNCGSLNETGMAEIQNKLFSAESYDMSIMKIASCVTNPKLALRFRKGFDFVDVILSGGNCPAVQFLYGGDTKEFSAKPIKEWLDTFIEAVSNDLEPVKPEELEKAAANMFRKRAPGEEDAPPPEPKPAGPKMWGRRAVRPQEKEPEALPDISDSSVPPPPR
ncbi:MAG: hypothetical protein IKR09_07080 [Alphaproteobacteria bacterium]|nr:hypothetical protein [Alphaproteobacteria bacterium]